MDLAAIRAREDVPVESETIVLSDSEYDPEDTPRAEEMAAVVERGRDDR